MVELMCDAALALSPGRVVVGVDGVRAMRWLEVAPATRVSITAEAACPDRIEVTIEGYATATVLVADGYPAPPDHDDPVLTGERPPPVAADRLYADGWLFHGPRFASIATVEAFADDGVRATLTVLPAPGAVLDAVSQILGHRTQQYPDADGGGRVPMPVGIERVRWYGPRPADGVRLACTGEVAPGGERPRGGAVLRVPGGPIWATVDGLTYRRVGLDERTRRHIWAAPDRGALAEPRPGGWHVVRDTWPDPAALEFVARRYLNAVERTEYAALPTSRRRSWLLGRVAVKDAVRAWLHREGEAPAYPAELTVRTDATGRLVVTGRVPAGLDIPVAQTGSIAAAAVRPREAGRTDPDPDRVIFDLVDGDGGPYVVAVAAPTPDHQEQP
jgi:hypothetical protein